ncbi:hypothetical protein COCON_G00049620 [Conger conger]|uniref:CCHC-type domain-containing protein n=1 Tax=Conger conger TaxID=82655 RepID=A0A9Q1DVE3_CONCO|nr:hypothetical protein COCON_G00049620 [Conger conger]
MNPADQSQLQSVLGNHGAALGHQQQQLDSFAQQLRAVSDCLANLTVTLQTANPNFGTPPFSTAAAPTAPPAPVREPRLPPPEKYAGEPGECQAFITQCQLIFQLQPSTFPTERSRVAYIITQLTGRAKKWGTAAWEAGLPCVQTSGLFMEEMKRMFDRSRHGREAAREILRMHQGERSVSDFAIDFQTLATSCGWASQALYDTFLNSLAERIKDELLTRELPDDLEQLIALAIRVDSRLRDRRRFQSPGRPVRSRGETPRVWSSPSPREERPTNTGEAEPMRVDRAWLTREEKERRMRGRLCLYCGQEGHFVSNCPGKANAH